MLKLNDHFHSPKFTHFLWLLMALQAGYINVGGFFISGNFVSHVTGTSSNIGIGIAEGNSFFILNFLVILISFIAGASFVGQCIQTPLDTQNKPRYILVLTIKCLFFALVLLLSEIDLISSIATYKKISDLLIIFFLSFCCGIQNAMCSLATKGFLKPTHMTGLSTQLGLDFSALFNTRLKINPELKKNFILRAAILTFFILGGVIATYIFSYNGHYGFLFPFLTSLYFLVLEIIYENKIRA